MMGGAQAIKQRGIAPGNASAVCLRQRREGNPYTTRGADSVNHSDARGHRMSPGALVAILAEE
jgi:hypothetical protein